MSDHATRLASLREKAAILGIDISDLGDDVDAIHSRISSYRVRSASIAARRGGFTKVATAMSLPEQVEIQTTEKSA